MIATDDLRDHSLAYQLGLDHYPKYDADVDNFYYTGMKFMFFPGDVIKRIELSVSNPPSKEDNPLPIKGYFVKAQPSAMVEE